MKYSENISILRKRVAMLLRAYNIFFSLGWIQYRPTICRFLKIRDLSGWHFPSSRPQARFDASVDTPFVTRPLMVWRHDIWPTLIPTSIIKRNESTNEEINFDLWYMVKITVIYIARCISKFNNIVSWWILLWWICYDMWCWICAYSVT